MSSFGHGHHIYLFALRNGRRRLAWGRSPEDALAILRLRLNHAEMAEIIPDSPLRIRQQDVRRYLHELG